MFYTEDQNTKRARLEGTLFLIGQYKTVQIFRIDLFLKRQMNDLNMTSKQWELAQTFQNSPLFQATNE